MGEGSIAVLDFGTSWTSLERSRRYPLCRRVGWLNSRSGRSGVDKKSLAPAVIRNPAVQPAAIPNDLSPLPSSLFTPVICILLSIDALINWTIQRQMNEWMMNWKGYGRKRSWLNHNISCHLPGRPEESHENVSQDSQCPGWVSNRALI
jgi:hypothetical protein